MDEMNEEIKLVSQSKSKKYFIFTFKEILFILATLVLEIGVEFGYDTPGALQVTLMKCYDLSYYQYSLFYSLYSVPNIVHSFIGGFLIDRFFGIKLGTVVYLSVALMGMVIFAAGAQLESYWIMLAGSFVFGIGAEMSGNVCMNYFTYAWFSDSYVNVVYSLSDNMGYVGTLLAYSISPKLYELISPYYNTSKGALDLTLTCTSALFIITFLGGLTMALLKQPAKHQDNTLENSQDFESKEKIKFTDCYKFPPQFWLLCILYGCYLNGIYTIQDFQQDFLVKEFSKTVDEANIIVNTLVIVQLCTTVPFSITVDRIGRNTLVATISIVIALLGHVFIFLRVSPYISLGLLGLSYSLMGSTVWPMFAYPLQKKHCGLGYGIASCFQSLSLTLCPMLAGKIIDAKGYFAAEYFYVATLIASFLSVIAISILDRKSSGVLSMTAGERKEYLKRMP